MEGSTEDPKVKFSLILGRLEKCKNRLRSLSTENRLRDIDQIWEAYCEVEEGIALSNFVLRSFDSLGVRRRLTVTANDNPETMSEVELQKKLFFVEENISSSIDRFSIGNGTEAAELARRARDVLKSMLIAQARDQKKSRRIA